MVVPAAIETAVSAVVGVREVTLDTPDSALKVMTRKLKDASVYLFFNEGAQAIDHAVTVKAAGQTAEAWDPQTAEIRPVMSKSAKGGITFKIALKPYQTELLVVRVPKR